MNRFSTATALLVALGCAACSQTWGRPGSTQAELNQEVAYCRMLAAGIQASGPPPAVYPQGYGSAEASWAAASNSLMATSNTLVAMAVRGRAVEDCLIARGWTRAD